MQQHTPPEHCATCGADEAPVQQPDGTHQCRRCAAKQPPMVRAGEALLVRAVTRGALRPDEAIELYRRTNR